jgi:DNA-binding MarR family transcriptional regulator
VAVSESREQVERYVRARPGVHFSAIVDGLDQATGQVQHHAARLVRAGRLERETLYGRTHFYPAGYDERERTVIALLRRETTGDLVHRLLSESGRRPAELASDLDVARSTVEYHLDRLVDHDLVEKRRGADGRVTVHLTRPRETGRLFAEVEPGTFARLVDRFERLTDRLLDETAATGETEDAG